VKVVNSTRGPVITQYELELQDAGMRVNKLSGFEKDLSLRLGTEGIRIVAPLPNKKTIGIEVPNRIKEPVTMKDLVEETDSNVITLPLIIGRDVLGDAMVGDLAKMPHLLIAGATGMGKSVCLNAIITSVLLFRGPDEVKFIMVDPKMVELAPYEGIPHLLTPPITDMSKAHAALEWACKTMDERFFALRMAGVRDIITFNQLGEEEIRKRLEKKGKTLEDLSIEATMPWIVIVVDEFADLMMVNKEVEKSIIRLCAKSRACGIHVILATQRPSADVVTGLIKSNMPSRICFRVADKNNSRVVLDHGGAENLLGRGDMLYLPPGSSSLVRGQGVWVKDEEIQGIIDHAMSQGEPEYDDSIFSAGAAAMSGGGGSAGDADNNWLADRQFHEAVWNMYRANKTGADFLRRRLGVGYNKATKYVEYLEDLGFLSEAKGSKPREFLRSWDDWIDELKIGGLSWEEDDEIYTNPLKL
jgi:S-DNA-T family DNA segregation ATPase FtsK/SpoIIIE